MENINLDLVLVKLSSLCNIKCSYCYIYETGYINSLANQPKIISEEIIIHLADQLTHLKNLHPNLNFSIVFHGGEPLLVGNKRLEFILEAFKNFPKKSIQTNGVLLKEETLDLLYDYDCSLGLSLDGPPKVNDQYRLDKQGKGTFDKVYQNIEKIMKHPIYNDGFAMILAVIDPKTDPIEVYDYLCQFKPKGIDFLLKDGCYDRLPEGKQSLDSTEYGQWLTKLAWHYFSQTNPIPIRKIDTLVEDYLMNKTRGHVALSPFGMVVVNPDGNITKNELYDITALSSKFQRSWNIKEDSLLDLIRTDEYKSYSMDLFPQSEICHQCEHFEYCGGGAEIHTRYRKDNNLKNPSVYCADYRYFYQQICGYLDKHLP